MGVCTSARAKIYSALHVLHMLPLSKDLHFNTSFSLPVHVCQTNMNISKTSGPITIKSYLKHHWGGGKAALGFGADWLRTPFSMATDSSHRVIMVKTVPVAPMSSNPFYICQ